MYLILSMITVLLGYQSQGRCIYYPCVKGVHDLIAGVS